MTLQQNNIIAKVRPGQSEGGFEVSRLILKFRLPKDLTRNQCNDIISSLSCHQNIPSDIAPEVHESVQFAMDSVKGLTSSTRDLCLTTMLDTMDQFVQMNLTFQSQRNLDLFLNKTGIEVK